MQIMSRFFININRTHLYSKCSAAKGSLHMKSVKELLMIANGSRPQDAMQQSRMTNLSFQSGIKTADPSAAAIPSLPLPGY